jgi:hypothetical protein
MMVDGFAYQVPITDLADRQNRTRPRSRPRPRRRCTSFDFEDDDEDNSLNTELLNPKHDIRHLSSVVCLLITRTKLDVFAKILNLRSVIPGLIRGSTGSPP